MVPGHRVGLGHGDEIGAEEHARHAVDLEDAARQRRFGAGLGVGEIGGAGIEHGLAGKKFERRRVRRGFGLNEHIAHLFWSGIHMRSQAAACQATGHRPLPRRAVSRFLAAMPDHLKGLLFTGIGVLLIVPDSLFVRLIDAPPLTIAFWRSLLAALSIGAGLLIVRGPRAFSGLAGLGPGLGVYIVTMAVPGVLFVLAVSLTSVANVVFIIAAMPAFAALLSWLFLGERLSRRTGFTIAVVAVGITIIAYGSGETAGASLAGDALALLIPLLFAAALTAARQLRATSLIPAIPIAYFAAAAAILPFTDPFDVAPGDGWLVALHGGAFIAVSTALITVGPRYLPSAEVALLILLESVLAPLLVWAALGEDPGRWALAGGALVIGALAVSNLVALRRGRARRRAALR